MKVRPGYLYIALFSLIVSPSLAQATRAPFIPKQPDATRVQVSVSFFIDDDAKDIAKSTKLAEETRQKFYEMAGHECELLKSTVASECKLDNVSININRQQNYAQKREGFTATGMFVYRISPK
jgi:hypothetical protein